MRKALSKITSYNYISKDKVLVSYVPRLDEEIIKNNNLDLIKLVTRFKDSEIQSLNVASIPISAAVTSYARIHTHLARVKLS